eukprot:TRINITY_DN13292_c0_g1_i1.p1 TRINITY_DN13292_c0_g1~~TRINITY_DN13292_c0_g1_i1.p1  ORF type:complete len:782 (+),score=186.38 TRINITY_DN13292_c0_g1_i1:80-2347(+)
MAARRSTRKSTRTGGGGNVQARWMWADVGLSNVLAQRNPLRWSPYRTIDQTIEDLERYVGSGEDRPLWLQILEDGETNDKPPTMQKMANVRTALDNLRWMNKSWRESLIGSEAAEELSPTTAAEMDTQMRLYRILKDRMYLNKELHFLNGHVRAVQEALDSARRGDEEAEAKADDLLDRLERELDVEEETLARAFKLFDNGGHDALSRADVRNMNRYLGFPADDADVDELMRVVDTDGSGTITFREFDTYVGWVGGTGKLFEERQKRITAKAGGAALPGSETTAAAEAASAALHRCGIDLEAQAYWRMVVPESDFLEAARLLDTQASAVAHIRRLAKKSHAEALSVLQDRLAELGFQDDHLWLTLAWIRELAPIIIHLDLNKALPYLESDTHYRNQFETHSSGGLLNSEVRRKWERDLFGGAYDRGVDRERPKYGVQNVMNDHRGVLKCAQYGDSYIILKDIRLRCTFSPEDSANLKAGKLAVPDFYAHVLNEYSDAELRETVKVATSPEAALLGDSGKVGKMKYKEAQIHGEIAFDRHVERLVASTKHREDEDFEPRLRALCAKFGWEFSWMDEESERMSKEARNKLGGSDWRSRLTALQEGGGDLEVPAGFCKVGCGRRIAPGVTSAGNAFTTCCRGCVMGFGHDRCCGRIDPTKVGPGLCKMGCGLPVAKGHDASGRRLTTCCRGCALGLGRHDAFCQRELPMGYPQADGRCKMSCGRPVAPGVTASGRKFDTCCRECAWGKGRHSPTCIEC